MTLTRAELAWLDAQAADRLPPAPPALPGLAGPATVAALIAWRRARLAR